MNLLGESSSSRVGFFVLLLVLLVLLVLLLLLVLLFTLLFLLFELTMGLPNTSKLGLSNVSLLRLDSFDRLLRLLNSLCLVGFGTLG